MTKKFSANRATITFIDVLLYLQLSNSRTYAVGAGLIQGRGGDDYAWNENLTRAEAVTVMSRMIEK